MKTTAATTTNRSDGHRGWRAPGPAVPAAIRGEASLPRLATLPPEAVLRELGVDAGGLSHEEAAARLELAGPNRLPQARGPGLPRQFAAQLLHFFALLLWVAAVLAFVGQMPQLGWAIIAVVIVNGAFSFVQEYRAERATRALAALLPEEATALRDGRKRRVPAAELVPGDVLLLAEGDRVSVDARVLQSDDLKVDNAALTGESEPVPRGVEALAEAPPDPAEAPNLVFAGTYVASGSGWVVVVATGARTRLGAISRLTGEVARRPTPAAGPQPVGTDHRRLRGRHRRGLLRRVVGPRDPGPGRLPVRRRGDRRPGPRGAAAHPDPVAGHERDPHGQAWRAGPPPGGRGDTGLDHGDLLRQDRHPDRQPDDGPRGRRRRVPLHHLGDRL